MGLYHNSVGSDNILRTIKKICRDIILALRNGNKLLLCGKGGSAAGALQLAAEFSGKFFFDREPLMTTFLPTSLWQRVNPGTW